MLLFLLGGGIEVVWFLVQKYEANVIVVMRSRTPTDSPTLLDFWGYMTGENVILLSYNPIYDILPTKRDVVLQMSYFLITS